MNRLEARRILALYRPGTADADDPEIAAALVEMERDPELRHWFEQHCAFQSALRQKFRQIPVPEEIRERILARRKVVRPSSWWQKGPVWLATAAAAVILGSLVLVWSRPDIPDKFADFRARMVRIALRQYRMDVITNSMPEVQGFLASKGAPADYQLPSGLAKLQLTGGGFLRWRGNPVSMVCFDRGDSQMLFLFVVAQTALPDAPPTDPQVSQVNKMITVSWTQADKTYVLAGPEEPGFRRKYL